MSPEVNCPDCNGDSRVTKTVVGVDVKQRFRECVSCGTRWVSQETHMRLNDGRIATWGVRSPREATGNRPATHGQPAANLPATGAGGVGGGVSSGLLFPDPIHPDPISRSGSDTDRDPDPSARKSHKKHPTDGFEEWYSLYPRKVARDDAEKAWRQKVTDENREAVMVGLTKQIAHWLAVKSVDKTRVPFPASWLRARRWEDDEDDYRPQQPRIVAPGSSYCEWHRDPGHNNKPSFRPRDGCPECKHCGLLTGTVSDVYAEDPMVTDIKRRRGLL